MGAHIDTYDGKAAERRRLRPTELGVLRPVGAGASPPRSRQTATVPASLAVLLVGGRGRSVPEALAAERCSAHEDELLRLQAVDDSTDDRWVERRVNEEARDAAVTHDAAAACGLEDVAGQPGGRRARRRVMPEVLREDPPPVGIDDDERKKEIQRASGIGGFAPRMPPKYVSRW